MTIDLSKLYYQMGENNYLEFSLNKEYTLKVGKFFIDNLLEKGHKLVFGDKPINSYKELYLAALLSYQEEIALTKLAK